ncbi:hypothetical protein FRX31_029722 [Thalictrum thalictroides]|uniref:DUF4283 domain-containing protein n=1 Tax=Thalictrum thalictroides TaxID=46969 RepID=A0A7J6V901_THATH|nr:hypothetical protein FRX31_029722 [Thalictrum thalictroides]
MGKYHCGKLSFSMVKSMVEKKWKLKRVMEMMLDGDFFYFDFSEFEDREAILDDGAFHMLGKLFIISLWSRDIEDNRGQISKIPLWVNLYRVLKYIWNSDGLSFIVNMVGKPLFIWIKILKARNFFPTQESA